MTDVIRERWLAKLAKLNVDRARGGPAPHKPLLLLVLIELAHQGRRLNRATSAIPGSSRFASSAIGRRAAWG